MDEELKKFKISELRQRKKLTQSEVASKYGVSLTTYNTWENNFGKLSVSKAKELVYFLSDGKLTLDNIIF